MRKFILFALLIWSCDVVAQFGYYYGEKYIHLTPDPIAPSLIVTDDTKINAFGEERNDSAVIKISETLFLVRDLIVIKGGVYKSERFISSSGNASYILPRIVLSVKSSEVLDFILKSYKNDLKLDSLLIGSDVYLLSCKCDDARGVLTLVSKIHDLDGVNWCEPDLLSMISGNNTYYPHQYYLHNAVSGQYDINIEPAWKLQSGDNDIVVAVVDEGIDPDHEDLNGRVLYGYTVGDASGNGSPKNTNFDSQKGHGVACAGIIGALDNEIGVKGVTSKVKLLPINIVPYYANRIYNYYGYGSDSEIAAAIQWAADRADILSCSWGGGDENNVISSAIQYARTYGRAGKGCVVVFASGNNYPADVSFPANVDGVIAVGAVDRYGNITSYSQHGSSLDLVAFGGNKDIVTTDRMGTLGYNPNPYITDDLADKNYTQRFAGTSAACPQVAGVVALMLSVNPDLTESGVTTILRSTAHDLGTAGWDSTYGSGLVDAYAAVKACYYISGTLSLCDQALYTLNGNLNADAAIQWRVSSSGISIISGQGTDTVTLSKTRDCVFNLYADIIVDSAVVATISKENIVAGTPGLGLDIIPVHKDGTNLISDGWLRYSTNNGFYVEGFSNGAFTHLEAYLTNITGNTSIQLAHYQNLTPNATFVPIPYCCNTTLRFLELKVRGVNSCGASEWQITIIDLDHPGGPNIPIFACQQN